MGRVGLSNEDRIAIKAASEKGDSTRAISADFGIAHETVRSIIRGGYRHKGKFVPYREKTGKNVEYVGVIGDLRRDVEVLEVIIAHLREEISEGVAIRILNIPRVEFRDRMIQAVNRATGEEAEQ